MKDKSREMTVQARMTVLLQDSVGMIRRGHISANGKASNWNGTPVVVDCPIFEAHDWRHNLLPILWLWCVELAGGISLRTETWRDYGLQTRSTVLPFVSRVGAAENMTTIDVFSYDFGCRLMRSRMPGTVSTIPVISRGFMYVESEVERARVKWDRFDGRFRHSETSSLTTPRLTQAAWLKTKEAFESQMPCLNWEVVRGGTTREGPPRPHQYSTQDLMLIGGSGDIGE